MLGRRQKENGIFLGIFPKQGQTQWPPKDEDRDEDKDEDEDKDKEKRAYLKHLFWACC